MPRRRTLLRLSFIVRLAGAVLSCSLASATAVGAQITCAAVDPCGDLDGSGSVAASDALRVLRESVGLDGNLQCQCEAGGTALTQTLQTGQTECYNAAGTSIACAGTGQDGELQLGAVRAFTDNGDGTITDEATGLEWEKLSNDGSVHDWNNLYTWENAFGKVATLNTMAFAGHGDWRLPNRFELETLINLAGSGPATFSAFATACPLGCTPTTCSCTVSGFYWSSTSYDPARQVAWCMSFVDGSTDRDLKSPSTHFARAVRGPD